MTNKTKGWLWAGGASITSIGLIASIVGAAQNGWEVSGGIVGAFGGLTLLFGGFAFGNFWLASHGHER